MGVDGYTFEEKEKEELSFMVRVIPHNSLEDLRASFPQKVENGRELQAYSIIDGRVCEIHVINPEQLYAPEWLGHELSHCVWGRFHS